jgi:hypothetical protein
MHKIILVGRLGLKFLHKNPYFRKKLFMKNKVLCLRVIKIIKNQAAVDL